MTAEQECDLARRIIGAEQRAHAAIAAMAEARGLLGPKASAAHERTRSHAVARLEQAVARCAALQPTDPRTLSAQAALQEAEALRWTLALSARQVARVEARKHACSLMDAEDLEQHGFIGLLAAAARFDPDREIRFATYARWWVRAHMTRALENTGRTVRLPGGAVEEIRNLRRAAARLEHLGGETPEVEDLAEEVGIEPRRARMLLRQGGTVSIEQETASGARLEDALESDTPNDAPDDLLILRQSLDRMTRAFDSLLDEREKYILTHHYGLNDVGRRSMSSIGQSIGISRERVRQIEVGALLRLRDQIAS